LVTEMRTATGTVRLTDAMLFRSGADLREDVTASRQELMRHVHVLCGRVRLKITIEPRGGATFESRGDGLRVRCADHDDLDLQLWAVI